MDQKGGFVGGLSLGSRSSASYDAKPEGRSRVYELSRDFVHSLPKPEKEKKASKGKS